MKLSGKARSTTFNLSSYHHQWIYDSMISTSCIYQSLKLIKVNQTGDQNNLTTTVTPGNTDPEVATIKSVRINVMTVFSGTKQTAQNND